MTKAEEISQSRETYLDWLRDPNTTEFERGFGAPAALLIEQANAHNTLADLDLPCGAHEAGNRAMAKIARTMVVIDDDFPR